jgi:hypothetical protein
MKSSGQPRLTSVAHSAAASVGAVDYATPNWGGSDKSFDAMADSRGTSSCATTVATGNVNSSAAAVAKSQQDRKVITSCSTTAATTQLTIQHILG